MTQTSNYGLSQWEKADRIQMENFNSDNAKIDAALKASADAVASHTTALAKLGNCQIYTTSYTGTGTYGSSSPSTLTFPHKPMLVFIFGKQGGVFRAAYGITIGYFHTTSLASISVSWSDNTMSWYSGAADGQSNVRSKEYVVLALLAADA